MIQSGIDDLIALLSPERTEYILVYIIRYGRFLGRIRYDKR